VSAWSWPVRTCGDDDSVDRLLHEGVVEPGPVSAGELTWAAEWLAAYVVGTDETGGWDLELAQLVANVVGHLVRKAAELERRQVVAAAKRAWAAEHGVPVSRVRLRR
jgi:hypothetical protein